MSSENLGAGKISCLHAMHARASSFGMNVFRAFACIAVVCLVFTLAVGMRDNAYGAEPSAASAPTAQEGAGDSANANGASNASGNSEKSSNASMSVDARSENIVDPTQRADNSFIYDTTISSLYEQASLYDGRTVQVEGEVIGDFIYANSPDGSGWITLASLEEGDSSSISVLMSAEQAKQIDHFGRYGVTGTTLQVRGLYHQACADHEGLPDLHAINSAVLARGIESPDKFVFEEFVPGVLVVIAGFLLMGVFYFLRERMR